MRSRRRAGFSLIELVMVIVVVAIAAVAIGSGFAYIARSQALSADPAACRRRAEVDSLLAGMAAYCETAQAYNEQLLDNLALTLEAMQHEARSAAFFKRQFALVHADWVREQERSDTYLATFQAALTSKKAA